MKKQTRDYFKKLTDKQERDLISNGSIDFSVTNVVTPALYVYVNNKLYRVLSSTEFRKATGFRSNTLVKRRLQNTYKEGLHYFKIGNNYYYNFNLLYD